MIYLIIKSYFTILLAITAGSILILGGGLYWIFKSYFAHPKPVSLKKTLEIPPYSPPLEQVKDQPSVAIDQLPTDNAQGDKLIESRSSITITSTDITAIAGDDVFATQLDLARAYIETGRRLLAKKILDHVLEQGSDAQQAEARNLLGLI